MKPTFKEILSAFGRFLLELPLDKVERRLYESVFTINPFKRFKN